MFQQVEIRAGEIKHIATAWWIHISLSSLPSRLKGLNKYTVWTNPDGTTASVMSAPLFVCTGYLNFAVAVMVLPLRIKAPSSDGGR